MNPTSEIGSTLPGKAKPIQSVYPERLKQKATSTSISSPDLDQKFTDLLCFAHLRWNFVYQRPQPLLSRAATQCRVWYIEEPIWQDSLSLEINKVAESLLLVVPHLPRGIDEQTALRLQRQLMIN